MKVITNSLENRKSVIKTWWLSLWTTKRTKNFSWKRKTISKGNKGLVVDKIIIPEQIENQFAEDIHLLLAKKLTDDWYEKYGELLKNIEDNDGRFNVKRSHPTLGDWLNTQRILQRNNELLQKDFYY